MRIAQQAAYLAAVFGGEMTVRSVDDAVAELDDWLLYVPPRRDDETRQLRQALGLRGTG